MQACSFRQHASWTVHRVAMGSYLAPDKPLSECLPYSLEDQSLWSGNVPQPEHWLKAWRACVTPASFESALAYFSTDDYCRGEHANLKWQRPSEGISLLIQEFAPLWLMLNAARSNGCDIEHAGNRFFLNYH